ncbi:unnamed protein product [Periconia digitata]|uniref:Uncharacterized protein n=1 Tax=Periconia digitata TaxID=1303443 RepID=A0A9W4XH93_9PLEO|nr:unnamed protein product [Periconia digitata]
MNTIAPAPTTATQAIKRLPPHKRIFAITLGLTGAAACNLFLGYQLFSLYSRNTTFLPYDTSSPDLATPVFKSHNKLNNPPVCIDHAVKTIPLAKLKENDLGRLTTDFCRGVWSGVGYAVQRKILERKYKGLEGREGMLWGRKELGEAEYKVGEVVTDHFEVVEHTDDKVIVRCGDSPLNKAPRPSDGLFAMEVTKDDEAQTATFHLKSVFVDTTPDGQTAEPLPGYMQFLHRLYTKLWMESATRKLLK